jgi:hypothetical protein
MAFIKVGRWGHSPRLGPHSPTFQPAPHAGVAGSNTPAQQTLSLSPPPASLPPQAQVPDMDPSRMAWQFPPMTDIDRENPGPAFKAVSQ